MPAAIPVALVALSALGSGAGLAAGAPGVAGAIAGTGALGAAGSQLLGSAAQSPLAQQIAKTAGEVSKVAGTAGGLTQTAAGAFSPGNLSANLGKLPLVARQGQSFAQGPGETLPTPPVSGGLAPQAANTLIGAGDSGGGNFGAAIQQALQQILGDQSGQEAFS